MVYHYNYVYFMKQTFKIWNLIYIHILELTLKHQPHKMGKHTQTIPLQPATNCSSVFDHVVGLAIKGLSFPFQANIPFLHPPFLIFPVCVKGIMVRNGLMFYKWKLSPHPHVPLMFGLLKTNSLDNWVSV